MAIYFEGTSTKERYEVGREYVNSRGQVVTANSDGSFGNRETGQVSRGSSYNPDVAWFADGADGANWGAYHNQPANNPAFYTDDGRAVYTNHGTGATETNGRSGDGTTPAVVPPRSGSSGAASASFNGQSMLRINGPVVSQANRGAFLRDQAWSGKDDPGQDMLWGGFHYMANPRWTNMELLEARLGDSELISTVLGLATLGADLGYSARNWADRNGFDNGLGPAKVVQRAVQPDSLVGAFQSLKDAANDWARPQVEAGKRQQAAQEDLNDAWDYRMELQEIESRKTLDAVLDPNNYKVQDRLTPNVWGY